MQCLSIGKDHDIDQKQMPEPENKGSLGFPCYCLCFAPVKARRQKPDLMLSSHAGLPGWLAPTRLIGYD